MLDQLLGVILLGLGLQTPMTPPMVKGDETEQSHSNSGSGSNDSGDEDESETESEGATGTSGTTATSTSHTKDGMPINLSPQRHEIYKTELERRKKILEAKRKETELHYKEKRETLKKELLERKDVYHQKKSSPTAEFRVHMAEEKEAFIASMKAKIEQTHIEQEIRLSQFKEKMEAFKNSEKKSKVEDIQSRLISYVTKRIETMTAQITKMNDIVGNNTSQVSEHADGKDTTSFDAAVSAAQTAINAAKDAISALGAKQYVITIGSEATAKNDVKTVRDTVEADMKSVRERMKQARVAVSTMIIERAKLLGEPVPEAVVK